MRTVAKVGRVTFNLHQSDQTISKLASYLGQRLKSDAAP